jgi:hypothetical protein
MTLLEHILRTIARSTTQYGMGGGRSNRLELDVIGSYGSAVTPIKVRETVWLAISRGLLFLDYEQYSTDNWYFTLSDAGRAILDDTLPNPDDPQGYVTRLRTIVPSMSPLVEIYVTEAALAFEKRCYLASVVMLGVASEAAFFEMAKAFARSPLVSGGREKLIETIEGSTSFVQKFEAIRTKLQMAKASLPEAVRDGLALNLDAIVDLLRINRNEAGHPTGRRFDRADAFNALTLFSRYLSVIETIRLYSESLQAHEQE